MHIFSQVWLTDFYCTWAPSHILCCIKCEYKLNTFEFVVVKESMA